MKPLILFLMCLFYSCTGCAFSDFLTSDHMTLNSECYYESIKHGNGDWEQEKRIYRACMQNKN